MKKLISVVTIVMIFAGALLASDRFTVANNTKNTIKRLLARESGSSKWNEFSIGSGIAPGKSVTIAWAASTEDSNCEWEFKAIFADGSESEPAEFDTCEDHDMEFN